MTYVTEYPNYLVNAKIYLKSGSVPVVHPPCRAPIAIRDKLNAELERMEREHVIKKGMKPTDWVNSLVTVEKPNGSIRICLGPKDLNDAIKRPHYPNKTLDDILPDLTDANIAFKIQCQIRLLVHRSYTKIFISSYISYTLWTVLLLTAIVWS